MRIPTILIIATAVGGLSITAASAQNQPAPDAQHHDQMDRHHDQMDQHKEVHRDMHRWHGHRHCTWKWRHHHRVRVCW